MPVFATFARCVEVFVFITVLRNVPVRNLGIMNVVKEEKDRAIVLDKKKLVIGLLTGALLCGISVVFFSVKAGVVFFVVFTAVGAVSLNIRNDRWFRILRAGWLFGAILCTAEASQLVSDGDHLWRLRIQAGILDVMCTAMVFLAVGIIVSEIRAAWFICTFFVLLLSFVNAYVAKFRGNALVPHDIFSTGTALTVVSD